MTGETDGSAPLGDAETRRRAPTEFGFDGPDETWVRGLRGAMGPGWSRRIGDYELEREVGRGGQGIVYRARHVVSDRVAALKCLRSGAFASAESRARFEREVRLASTLRHPGVVTIYGVEIADGQPVIAMEWVDGEAITAWARPEGCPRRPIAEILACVEAVCDAVRHAHQRGVLHRDLKPSNVLVDAAGQPKVVDFGVAKPFGLAADSESSDEDVGLTASGDFVGTLAYASPEQVRDGARALDVRTDVWSIGAILYEMLTGRRPYEVGESLADAVRALERGVVVRPSQLAPDVGYELDTIVREALASDPEMRYQTVDAFADDLRRLREDRPILAHPPSTWYQIKKLVSRNRRPVVATAAAALLVLTLAVVSLVQADTIARTEEREAEARQLASDVTAYIQDLFRDLSPSVSGEPASLEGMIERATRRIDDYFAVDATLRAELRGTIGSMLIDLGSYDVATDVLRDALEIRERDGTAATLAGASGRVRLARALRQSGDYVGAKRELEAAIDWFDQHDDGVGRRLREHALALRELSLVETTQGNHDRSLALLRDVLARLDVGVDGGETLGVERASALLVLAELHDRRGEYLEALEVSQRALALRREVFGPKHPAVAEALSTVGDTAESCGQLDVAVAAREESLAIFEHLFGTEHPRSAAALTELGELRALEGRPDEALALLERAQDVLMRVRGGDSTWFATALSSRATLLLQMKGPDAAEQLMRESLAILRSRFSGPQHSIASVLSNLGAILAQQGFALVDRANPQTNDKIEEARRLFVDANAMFAELPGVRHTNLALGSNSVGALASYVGDFDDAEQHYRDAIRWLDEGGFVDHALRVTVWTNLAAVERDRARAAARAAGAERADLDEAIRRFERAVRSCDEIGMDRAHPERLFAIHQLVTVLGEAGRADERRETLERALAVDTGERPDVEGFVDDMHMSLVLVLIAAGEYDDARARIDFLETKLERFRDASRKGIADVYRLYSMLHEAKGEVDESKRWREKAQAAADDAR